MAMSTQLELQYWQLGRIAKLSGEPASACPQTEEMLQYYWLEGYNDSRVFTHNYEYTNFKYVNR